jgi:hypothetical protein
MKPSLLLRNQPRKLAGPVSRPTGTRTAQMANGVPSGDNGWVRWREGSIDWAYFWIY